MKDSLINVYSKLNLTKISQKSSFTLTNTSFENDFKIGCDNLATANNSCELLYNPTVVRYVFGLLANVGCLNAPFEPVT